MGTIQGIPGKKALRILYIHIYPVYYIYALLAAVDLKNNHNFQPAFFTKFHFLIDSRFTKYAYIRVTGL